MDAHILLPYLCLELALNLVLHACDVDVARFNTKRNSRPLRQWWRQ